MNKKGKVVPVNNDPSEHVVVVTGGEPAEPGNGKNENSKGGEQRAVAPDKFSENDCKCLDMCCKRKVCSCCSLVVLRFGNLRVCHWRV